MKENRNVGKINWEDLVSPSKEELDSLVSAHSLPSTAVEDCLEPEHLPKVEKFENCLFIISRHFDKQCSLDADTTQELTRKIAFFITDNSLITLHRQKPDFWDKMVAELSTKKFKTPQELAIHILYWVFDSYELFLNDSTSFLEKLEGRVFHHNTGTATLQQIHQIKKRLSVVRHILGNTQSIVHRYPSTKETASLVQDMREELEAVIYRSTLLIEESKNLLELYISLSSHRANDIMKVLAMFSAFLLPPTLLVGVYGMNFQHMPELTYKYGYYGVWGLMALIWLGIYLWFKSKGWLK